MEFPKWKKRLRGLLSSAERVIGISKKVVFSAGLLTLTSGNSAGQPKVPVDPRQTLQDSRVSKYSTKYLLRSAARSGLSSLFLQHRSHSSHSSHASHASHYSSSSPGHASHASHYSSSGTTPPPVSLPTPAPQPPSRSRTSTSARGIDSPFGFTDNFADNALVRSTRWVTGALNADASSQDTEVSVAERNGRLEISPRANVSGRHFNGYLSTAEWDLRGAKVGVEVVQIAADAADTVFAIGVDSNNWYGFVVEGGTLYLQSKVNGSKSPQSVPYSAPQHRFWRFRLDAMKNTVAWETSPDGVTWSSLREEPLQMDITAVHVTLSAGTYQVTKSPGTAVFDNFRLER